MVAVAMSTAPSAQGAFQRVMFAVAYTWYAAEAVGILRSASRPSGRPAWKATTSRSARRPHTAAEIPPAQFNIPRIPLTRSLNDGYPITHRKQRRHSE